MPLRSLLVLLAAVVLTACNQSEVMEKFVPHEEDVAVRAYFEAIRKGDLASVEKDFDPKMKTPEILGALGKVSTMLAGAEPVSIKVVGAHVYTNPTGTVTDMSYEYQFPGKWFVANMALRKQGGATTIVGFHLTPLPDSLENMNRFTLEGKTPLEYLVLALAVVIPLFSIYALVVCVRSKIPRRKWLWVIFIILGVTKFSVNWTNGEWDFVPLALQLFGASGSASLYGAWIVSVSFPLGALVFLLMKKRLTAQPEVEAGGEPTP
jgi:hypothetical protein